MNETIPDKELLLRAILLWLKQKQQKERQKSNIGGDGA